MPGLPGRSHTTYDVYRDYHSDDLLDEMYPPDGGHYLGSQTPLPPDDRATPEAYTMQNGGFGPLKVIYPSNRPLSRSRSAVRPPSRVNASIQTEIPQQRNYAIPDADRRLTSPVQRLLERSHTQPMMNLQSLPSNDMDPITRQYYHRYWNSKSPSLDSTLYRYGRAGGVWRHIRACVANTGTQIAFIDGTVKQEDNVLFPPHQKHKSRPKPFMITSRLPPTVSQSMPRQKSSYDNRYSKHAREGFEYWYKEPKPIDLKSRMRFKARMVGLGY